MTDDIQETAERYADYAEKLFVIADRHKWLMHEMQETSYQEFKLVYLRDSLETMRETMNRFAVIHAGICADFNSRNMNPDDDFWKECGIPILRFVSWAEEIKHLLSSDIQLLRDLIARKEKEIQEQK